jgi:hypothetical protein
MIVKKVGLAGVVLAILASTAAVAGDSVIVGGQRYTCTNTCVVTPTGVGAYSVRDCCGGNVSWKVP